MPATIQTFQVMLGSSKWDAVNYVRNLTEDAAPPYIVPDSSYMALHEDVAEDFGRYVPLDYWVGNPVLITSPLQTVTNQQVYVCSQANGFTAAPHRIMEFLYTATNAFSAASEISYLALLPFSPLNRFLFTPSLLDSPTERILRDQYLSELDHYGRGYYAVNRDPATGLLSIALYPIPTQGGTPLYVHYQAGHTYTTDTLGNALYASVPDNLKRHFARLLYALVLEQEAERYAKSSRFQAGIVNQQASVPDLMKKADNVRQQVYQQLGEAVPAVFHSF